MSFFKIGENSGKQPAVIVECLFITAAALCIGFFFFPEDPFFIHAPFPWIWFASVLVALRYGFGLSLLSVIIIAATFSVAQAYGHVPPGFPKVFFFGGLMLTMLCGQLSTLWGEQLRRMSQLSDHAQERLEQVSRAYYVLRVSHDRMEQNLIVKPVTLRGAIMDLRRLFTLHGGDLSQENAKRFLSLLAQCCSLEVASLHLLSGGKIREQPVAQIGQAGSFASGDLLVKRALENKSISYSAVNELASDEKSRYLAVAPLCVSTGELLGLLLVEKIPFLSLNRENLQVLGVLLGYFTDQLSAARRSMPLLALFPDCPPLFASETIKLVRLKRDFNIDSAIVSIGILPNPNREPIVARLQRQQRGLDYLWHTRQGDLDLLITLMPFAGMVAVEGYLSRISSTLQKDFGIDTDSGIIRTRFTFITDDDMESIYHTVIGDEP
jgi:hypothetical protein